jgi:hypothetical protein
MNQRYQKVSLSLFLFYVICIMISYSELVFDSIVETQIKLKILFVSEAIVSDDKTFFLDSRNLSLKLFLQFLSTFRLKKVISSRVTNRIVLNYFKKFLCGSKISRFEILQSNKTFLESDYAITLAINTLYEEFGLF